MSVTLSSRDIAHLNALSTALLSPLQSHSVDEWRARVGTALCTLFDSEKVGFLLASVPGEQVLWSKGLPDAVSEPYTASFDDDAGIERSLRLGLGAYTQTAAVAGDWEWYHRDPFVADLYIPNGLLDLAGMVTQPAGPESRAQLVTFLDRYGTERFGAKGLALMQLARPAFEAGVASLRSLLQHRQSLTTTVDLLAESAWLFSSGGKLLHRNPAAMRVCLEDPSAREVENAVARVADLLLVGRRSEMAACGRTGASPTMEIRTDSARYEVRGCYVDAVGLEEMVLVLAERRSPPAVDVEAVRTKYGLTQRQVEVAMLLTAGASTKKIAEQLGISLHTARRHTEQIFLKLGIHSRAQLHAILLQPKSDTRGWS